MRAIEVERTRADAVIRLRRERDGLVTKLDDPIDNPEAYARLRRDIDCMGIGLEEMTGKST